MYNGGITTGLEDLHNAEVFEVYPNPTTGQFTVEIVNPTQSRLSLKLISLTGRVVYQESHEAVLRHKETINQNLPKGIYFLMVESVSGVKTQKLIIR